MVFLPRGFIVLATLMLCAFATSCKRAEPREYAVLDAPAPERSDDRPLSATLIVEVIQVESSHFERWIAEHTLVPDDATPLRKVAQGWIREGDADLAETLTLSVKNGGSSQIQSEQFVFTPKGERAFLPNKLGISLEASVSIDPDSRVCAVELNPEVLTPSDHENAKRHWSDSKLTTAISLAEMTYGFLGSCELNEPLSNRRKQQKRTSLFFLRADTNLPLQSAPQLTSQL